MIGFARDSIRIGLGRCIRDMVSSTPVSGIVYPPGREKWKGNELDLCLYSRKTRKAPALYLRNWAYMDLSLVAFLPHLPSPNTSWHKESRELTPPFHPHRPHNPHLPPRNPRLHPFLRRRSLPLLLLRPHPRQVPAPAQHRRRRSRFRNRFLDRLARDPPSQAGTAFQVF